jgi:hypothetical protein
MPSLPRYAIRAHRWSGCQDVGCLICRPGDLPVMKTKAAMKVKVVMKRLAAISVMTMLVMKKKAAMKMMKKRAAKVKK